MISDFFIQDILKREKIELMHCETEKMIADYFTKPLQGRLFRKLRDCVMREPVMPIEECVENHTKRTVSGLSIGQTGLNNGYKRSFSDVVRSKRITSMN